MLPGLLDQLRSLAKEADPQVTQLLTEAIDERMAKGEVLVAHLVGSGEQARVVDVERHLPEPGTDVVPAGGAASYALLTRS